MSIPSEIIVDILLRLPVKSLSRFRCVSKGWQSLISNPKFIKTHFNRSNLENLILLSNHPYLYSVDLVNESSLRNDSVKAKKLQFLPPQIWWDGVIGFCNGLVLATAIEKSCYAYLINPTTQQHIKVSPPPDQPDYNCDIHQVCGLGYDSLKDDYKVVVIAYYDVKNEQGIRFRDRFVNVYSLTSNSWRVIIPPNDHGVCTSMPGVYLNGCLHWLCNRVSDSYWVVAAFSLEEEVFEEVQLPSFVNDENVVLMIDKLVAVNERLCFDACWGDNLTDIWVMEKYGVKESWKKISICGVGMRMVKLLCLSGDNLEVVLEVGREKVVVYNVEAKTWKDVVICGIPCRFLVLGTYVESLASPRYGNGAEEILEG